LPRPSKMFLPIPFKFSSDQSKLKNSLYMQYVNFLKNKFPFGTTFKKIQYYLKFLTGGFFGCFYFFILLYFLDFSR
jgi:hypothetical protein